MIIPSYRELDQFITLFTSISNSPTKAYLRRKEGGGFEITSEKREKNLKSSEIVLYFEYCLNRVLSSMGRDGLETIDALIKLTQTYQIRIRQSDSWSSLALRILGIKSQPERQLERYVYFLKKWHEVTSNVLEVQNPKFWEEYFGSAGIHHRLRFFNNYVFNEKTPNLWKVDGNDVHIAYGFFIDHLEKFIQIKRGQNANQTELRQLEKLASKVQKMRVFYAYKQVRYRGKCTDIHDLLARSIAEQVRVLPPSRGNRGPMVVMEGGYKKHSVVYVITKRPDGFLDFEVIESNNLLEGPLTSRIAKHEKEGQLLLDSAPGSMTPEKFKERLDAIEQEQHDLEKVLLEEKFRHKIFSGLRTEELSPEFIKKLVLMSDNKRDFLSSFLLLLKKISCFIRGIFGGSSQNVYAQEWVQFLKGHLLKGGATLEFGSGVHRLQQKNDCVMKALSIFTSMQLGPSLHNEFDAYLSGELVKNFDEIITKIPSEQWLPFMECDMESQGKTVRLQAPIDRIRMEAQAILEERQNKAAASA